MKTFLVAVLIALATATPLAAQQNVPATPDNRFSSLAKNVIATSQPAGVVPADATLMSAMRDVEVHRLKLAKDYLKNAYEYDLKVLELRDNAYRWHHTSSIIIFWVVMFMIVAGVLLAIAQLMHDFDRSSLRLPSKSQKSGQKPQSADGASTGEPAPSPAEQETFKIGKEGIEIRTKVVGLLILGFSMAFFYLYLSTVYPIIESRTGVGQESAKTEQQK